MTLTNVVIDVTSPVIVGDCVIWGWISEYWQTNLLVLPYPGCRSRHPRLLVLRCSHNMRWSWSATMVYLEFFVSQATMSSNPSSLSLPESCGMSDCSSLAEWYVSRNSCGNLSGWPKWMPFRGSIRCYMTIKQTLWPFLAVMYVPSLVVKFSAVAVVVSHFIRVPSQFPVTFLPKESLGIITVCMTCVPSALGRHKWVVLIILLVLLPYAFKSLVMFLVPDHIEISFRISQGIHDTVHLDSASNPSLGFMEVGVWQSQGFAISKSFTLQAASSKDEAFHWVENYNLWNIFNTRA